MWGISTDFNTHKGLPRHFSTDRHDGVTVVTKKVAKTTRPLMLEMSQSFDCGKDFGLGSLTAFPALHGGVFVRLKKLVHLKEVANFVEQVVGQIVNVHVLIHP